MEIGKFIIDNKISDIDIIEQEEIPVFDLDEIKNIIPIEEIDGGYVSYILHENGVSLQIIFFEDFTATEDKEYVSLFYYVIGTGDNLRENRHTYFQDYYFYMNLKLLKSSTEFLMKHFD